MRKYLRDLISVFFCLLLVPSVHAMGLRAYDLLVEIDYKPNLEWSQRYQIVTTSSYAQDYRLYIQGDLAEYVTLEPDHFSDVAPGSNPFFTATLKLPGLDEPISPGRHTISIGAFETASSSGGGGGVGVLTGSEALVRVMFLYPGKYLEARLRAKDVAINEPANFEVGIFNGGKIDLSWVKAKIDVYDPEGKNIATVYTEEKPLKSNVHDTLHAQLDTRGLNSGDYKAIATVYYDGNEIKTNEAKFKIGSLEVRIIDHTKEVPAGKINAFDIDIESRWNNNIPNVYASVKIEKQTFQTPTTSIGAWERKNLTGYFDTTNINMGEYDAEITLNYGNNWTRKMGKVTVTKPEGIALTPIAPTTALLVIIIILLIMIDIGYLIYSRKRKGK
jgi:hypothetical protein